MGNKHKTEYMMMMMMMMMMRMMKLTGVGLAAHGVGFRGRLDETGVWDDYFFLLVANMFLRCQIMLH